MRGGVGVGLSEYGVGLCPHAYARSPIVSSSSHWWIIPLSIILDNGFLNTLETIHSARVSSSETMKVCFHILQTRLHSVHPLSVQIHF